MLHPNHRFNRQDVGENRFRQIKVAILQLYWQKCCFKGQNTRSRGRKSRRVEPVRSEIKSTTSEKRVFLENQVSTTSMTCFCGRNYAICVGFFMMQMQFSHKNFVTVRVRNWRNDIIFKANGFLPSRKIFP